MLPRIALISAKQSFERSITPILDELKKKCELVVLPYERLDDVNTLYLSCKDDIDGFLFSGWLPYSVVAAAGRLEKPYDYFTISEGDFYRVMFMACMENPGLDLSRVLLDDPALGTSLSELLPDIGKCRLTASNRLASAMTAISDDESRSGQVGELYSVAMESYLAAWKAEEIDLVVTRLTNLAPVLARYGVKHYVLAPGRASMLECAERLINRVNSGNYADMLTVCGMLETSAAKMNDFSKAVSIFNRKNGMNMVLSIEGGLVRLTTSNKHFKLITENLEECKLSSALQKRCDASFSFGWGVGYDLQSAHVNALKALKIARHSGVKRTFVVTEQGKVVGPLLGERRLSFDAGTDERTNLLSDRYDISRMNVKKIRALISQRKSNVFTSEELAVELGVSPRSARRILAKLNDTGGAEMLETNETGMRGRPAVKYCIKLE